jgi:hypothetical protein
LPNIYTPKPAAISGSASQTPKTYSGLTNAQVTSAGQVRVSLSDPNKSIQESVGNLNAGFIGMGKGLVNIAENLPVVGAIAKPVIGLVGAVMDNTIGRGVSLLEQIKIGDSNLAQSAASALEVVGTPLKLGLDALGAPGRFVQQKVTEAKILNAQSGRHDFITNVFGEAPASAVQMMRDGATLDEAAQHLVDSNAGYSNDGAINFLWSMLLDPTNLIIPGVGKAIQVGATAAEFARFTEAGFVGALKAAEGELAAAKAAGATAENIANATAKVTEISDKIQFMKKWDMAGKIYESTLGKVPLIARKFAAKPAEEAAKAIGLVHNSKVVDGMMTLIEKVAGRKVADLGLRNWATTFSNAVKSGSIRAVAAIRRSGSQDFAESVVSFLEDGLRQGKTAEELLSKSIDGVGQPIGTVLQDSLVRGGELDAAAAAARQTDFAAMLKSKIDSGVRADQLLRDPDVMKFIDEVGVAHANWRVLNEVDSMRAIAGVKVGLDARLSSEEAIRVLREAKLERMASAQNPTRALAELTQDLAGGFGLADDAAATLAKQLIDGAAGNIKDLADILSVARGANYGEAMRLLASVRQSGLQGIWSRITIISARSLTQSQAKSYLSRIDELEATVKAATDAGDNAAIAAAKGQMRTIADELVQKFDEFAARYPVGRYGYEQVFEFLRKAKNITVRDLSEAEATDLLTLAKSDKKMQAVAVIGSKLEKMGYKLGIAPESGVSAAPVMRIASHSGREIWDTMMTPFSDTIDHVGIDALDAGLKKAGLRQGTLAKIWDKMSRPYGAEIVKNNITERFVSSLVQKTTAQGEAMSVNRARSLMTKINNLATEFNLKPQALFMERRLVDELFTADELRALAKAGTDPITEMISAAAGDWSIAGLTSGFSGRVKAVFPAITIMTDRIYPELRFGLLNPFFNLVLERIETGVQMFSHGVKRDVADQFTKELRGTTLRKAYNLPTNVVQEIADGVAIVQGRAAKNTIAVASQAKGFRAGIARWFSSKKGLLSIKDVRMAKEAARDLMTDKFAAREFIDLFEQAAPGKLNELALHYGFTSAEDVVQSLMSEYIMMSRPDLLAKHIAENSTIARSLTAAAVKDGMKESYIKSGMTAAKAEQLAAKNAADLANTVMGAYELAITRAGRAADNAQYFSSQRTWLERSLNHPFLGLYPYSYMTRRAIPWMMRIMFLTPGPKGIIMPAFGYHNWMKIVEWTQNRTNSDSSVVDQLIQNDALMYVLNTLLPVTPDSMGFSAPAWVRRSVVQPALRGKALTPGELAPGLSEVGSQFWRGTAFGQVRTVLEGVQQVSDITRVNPTLSAGIQEALPQPEEIQAMIQQGLRQP